MSRPLFPYQLGQLSLALAFGIVIALLASLDLNPEDPQGRLILRWTGTPVSQLCRQQRKTGVDCPSCGLTRALVFAGRFDFESARASHSSAPALALLLLLQLLVRPFLARLRWHGRRAWCLSAADFAVNFVAVLWLLPRPVG